MNPSSIPEVLPVRESDILDALPVGGGPRPSKARRPRRPGPGFGHTLLGWVLGFIGWVWRLVVGSVFCFNLFSSILVTGWTYRWMRAVVLRGWWKRSRFREEGSFADFCASLGPDAPVARPRWFLQERVGAHLRRPTARGQAPGGFRKFLRALQVPWHSLWLNFKIGFQGLFCTYLLTGWGCLVMLFSWEFGWVNSFAKGYEQALIGPLTGLLGIALFVAAMFYVPMAQVHQAVTGRPAAFFEFRFVWRLIQARLSAYVGLAALVALASLPLEILKTIPAGFPQLNAFWETASDAEVLRALRTYFLVCCFVLFPTLLVCRLVAALVYRSAVLKVLRRGRVRREELHPTLVAWLDRLELSPPPARAPRALERVVRFGGRLLYRRLLFITLFLIWFAFIAKTYTGEFFNYHPLVGFMNHPLVQFPCFDYVPFDLQFRG